MNVLETKFICFKRNLSVFLDLELTFWPKSHLSEWVSGWISDLTNSKLCLTTQEKPRNAAWHG